ncbi:MAG TPA: cytochrome P450 [Ktedonobacteraceae bacterium]|nr:cytochrome P450 [Ktedonobacteraceae bacterium]
MIQMTMHDMFSQETRRFPLAFSARLREHGPLISFTGDPTSKKRSWIVTSYDDAVALLKDARFIKQSTSLFKYGEESSQEQSDLSNPLFSWRRDMLTSNPPDHTRLRYLVSKAFTPRAIEQLRPRIQHITDGLLDAVESQGRMDLVTDFALPLPITVISEMLGIPPADRAAFHAWTHVLLKAVGDHEQEQAALPTQQAFVHFIRTLIADKRVHPDDDLISNLVQAEEQGDRLSEIELVSTIWLLIVAGHETTVNLIGTGMLELLRHPEQLRLLQNDSSLLTSAVEELLRFVNPVMYVSRFASEDVPLHGEVIRKDELVIFSLMAADSDPQRFSAPETLNITREEKQHLAFGKGIHTCLGAPLARLEGQIAIGTLLHRFPHLSLASEPDDLTWTRAYGMRGVINLPVTF